MGVGFVMTSFETAKEETMVTVLLFEAESEIVAVRDVLDAARVYETEFTVTVVDEEDDFEKVMMAL